MGFEIIKTLYLIRHGETNNNAAGMSQPDDMPLSGDGLLQARRLAVRFEKEPPFQVVIASPYRRADQTARILADAAKVPIENNPLFREIKRPFEIVNMSFHDPKYMEVMRKLGEIELTRGAKYSDEETLFEMEARADEALRYIMSRPEKFLAVVSHIVFMRMLLTRAMISDSDLAVRAYCDARYFFNAGNTSVTKLEFTDEFRGGKHWRLRYFDDRGHLS